MEIENISQRYIEHLRRKKNRASESLKVANIRLDAAKQAFSEMESWSLLIAEYKNRLVDTQEAYISADKLIEKLCNLSIVITENVGYFSEAVETLVCIIREMSQRTDKLKNKMYDLKTRLATADKTRKYYVKLDELDMNIDDATKSNVKAIRAVLDLLKETFMLNANLKGNMSEAMNQKLIDELNILDKKLLLFQIGNTDWMEFFREIDVLQEFSSHNRGLTDNVRHLKKLLDKNNAYHLHDSEAKYLPFVLTPKDHMPNFPLSDEQYWKDTMAQYRDVHGKKDVIDKFDKVKARLDTAQTNYDATKAKLDALEAALKAAENAKKETGQAA